MTQDHHGLRAPAFCPDNLVTRGQMAAFLDRALHLPPTELDYFHDDNGSPFEASINRLAASGITVGCDPVTYCPNAVGVPRPDGVLPRARARPAPRAPWTAFTDDEGNTHEAEHQRLAAAGITTGCTPYTYCPSLS